MLKKRLFAGITLVFCLIVISFYWIEEPSVPLAQRAIVLFLGFVIGALPYVFAPRQRIIKYVDNHVLKPGQANPKGLTAEGLIYGFLGLVVYRVANANPSLFAIMGTATLSLAFGFLYFYSEFVEPGRKGQ